MVLLHQGVHPIIRAITMVRHPQMVHQDRAKYQVGGLRTILVVHRRKDMAIPPVHHNMDDHLVDHIIRRIMVDHRRRVMVVHHLLSREGHIHYKGIFQHEGGHHHLHHNMEDLLHRCIREAGDHHLNIRTGDHHHNEDMVPLHRRDILGLGLSSTEVGIHLPHAAVVCLHIRRRIGLHHREVVEYQCHIMQGTEFRENLRRTWAHHHK
mmetsp:Transcript_3489/g.13311  ORF Transcript_3489/g.13311 Transcript_3489/m.13311 type:complete len:208 (-) Transcript_3489:1080-1703(-)